jgi:uncharacterized protein YqjF (DUF2071 family)
MNPAEILTITDHRPWPLPTTPWAMRQTWLDLLFAHWRTDADALRANVPDPLEIDVCDGSAWIGIVPFAIDNLGVRSLPGIPTATDFLEINVRTYVRYREYAGVYFFTLDASSMLAVNMARVGFGLPYHNATMSMMTHEGWVTYRSERDEGRLAFSGRYRPRGSVFTPKKGSLEHFLTERYALFTVAAGGQVSRVDIHHAPWALQEAECDVDTASIIQTAGITLPADPPLCHFAARQDVVNWLPSPG